MVDLVERVRDGTSCEVYYVWFDTGLEYRATKEHLGYLEQRYGIEIQRRRAVKSIPACCKEYGQPFLSKYVSQQVSRLQKWGFEWEDDPFEALIARYPNCSSALKWWCNGWTRVPERPGWFDIGRNSMLKEFMVEHPPEFRISDKCCTYAKKYVARDANRELGIDLELVGVREAEGGIRAATKSFRKSCVSEGGDGVTMYRPLYWLTDESKLRYNQIFGIRNSDCYEVWGFQRTGCVGCPFGRGVLQNLEIARQYEPGIVRAVEHVFKDSYEYTRQYEDYKRSHGRQTRLEI